MEVSSVIERLSSLRRSALRKAASELDLPLVHAEIIEYLSVCNKYSNTPLALVEYLAQTKGSVSQSLIKMEENKLINRQKSKTDKRSIRLSLTAKGERYWQKIQVQLPDMDVESDNTSEELTALLRELQQNQGNQGFSVCRTCKYNQKIDESHFRCGLTEEMLTPDDVTKICREHMYA